MSASLIWELTKSNNRFLVKRNGHNFSSDPYNPSGKQIFSHSGFLNNEGIKITPLVNAEKKTKSAKYQLSLQKRRRFQQKSREATKTKLAQPEGFALHQSVQQLTCNGVNRASKVIRKQLNKKSPQFQKLFLKKLYLLHKAATGKSIALPQKK